MKKEFRLYNSLFSSYFDLIEGENEPKQTKGLGLLLAKSDMALRIFMNIDKIQDSVKLDLNSVDRVIVNCELPSKNDIKYRADIILRFYGKNNSPLHAILIEAKSLSNNISPSHAERQVLNYNKKNAFDILNQFEKNTTLITLTKYTQIESESVCVFITWLSIISTFNNYIIKNKDMDKELNLDYLLISDYIKFITKIQGAMKFYDEEIFSIPTNKNSFEAIQKYHFYECPNQSRFKQKSKSIFLAFRSEGGGVMNKLYKVDDVVIINLSNKEDIEMLIKDNKVIDRKDLEDFLNYMKDTNWKGAIPTDEKQLFVLSKENSIELQYPVKPIRNNSFRAYYSLSDFIKKPNKDGFVIIKGEKE